MTLTLPLTREQEKRLRAQATHAGLAVEDFALRRLLGGMPSDHEEPRRSARARVSAMGKYVHVPTTADDFARRKREEAAREDRPR